MGRLFIETLTGAKIFKCKFCKVDSASHDDIVSKEFYGRFGRAYLFRSVYCLHLISISIIIIFFYQIQLLVSTYHLILIWNSEFAIFIVIKVGLFLVFFFF